MRKFDKNLFENVRSEKDLEKLKRKIATSRDFPKNIDLLKIYKEAVGKKKIAPNKNLEEILKTRKIRSLSGIAVVSVLTKPYPCPGRCLYCPTEEGMPKSYLANEPAAMRAVLNNFDPYRQVAVRLKSLEMTGHPTDKIELIIIGGTWSFYPKQYQTWFIKRCFEAANKKSAKRKTQNAKQNLKIIQKINETAKHRIIGISIETRPDFINEKEIKRLRRLGVTKVELGVQHLDDEVLKKNLRGATRKNLTEATRTLKNAGFKVVYHMMPNLPGSDIKKDLKAFDELFKNPDFRPDMLKIYPCVVLKNSALYRPWQQKKYKPYTDTQLLNLMIKIKKKIPPYVRILRVIRDIPSPSIMAGSKISNLRQYIQQDQIKNRWQCQCIRCREIKNAPLNPANIKMRRIDYDASGGKEIFLSFEDVKRDKLIAFLRLRVNNVNDIASRYIVPVLKDAAIIRELHTYGRHTEVGKKGSHGQHLGFGKRLIKETERITKNEFGLRKIAVISGIGVKEYYRKLGYKEKDTYMRKTLE